MTNTTTTATTTASAAAAIIGDDMKALAFVLEYGRRRHQDTIDAFQNDLAASSGIAHAIGWNATNAIIAERTLKVIDRVESLIVKHNDLHRAIEQIEAERVSLAQEVGYFDPTSHSTSASQAYVGAATFQANRTALDLMDRIIATYADQLDSNV